jgi:hypothetical protein
LVRTERRLQRQDCGDLALRVFVDDCSMRIAARAEKDDEFAPSHVALPWPQDHVMAKA